MLASTLDRFIESGWVNVIGGCCGTGPEHIHLLSETAQQKSIRVSEDLSETRVSGIEALVIDEDTRPVIVGERTNVLGAVDFVD
ncbi:MAG: hypothetical protein Ct9H300mP27_02510 [Chloroflexota bacterium]|nr:MAG: hypothetical protein Ct9H300mP27_02510 [Chloroflexota bacterium]